MGIESKRAIQVLRKTRFEVFTANTSIIVAHHFTSRRKWDDEGSYTFSERRGLKQSV
jgi:hypothetical protein